MQCHPALGLSRWRAWWGGAVAAGGLLGLRDRPARPPMFSAAARAVGGASGLLAWAWAETFSLSML